MSAHDRVMTSLRDAYDVERLEAVRVMEAAYRLRGGGRLHVVHTADGGLFLVHEEPGGGGRALALPDAEALGVA